MGVLVSLVLTFLALGLFAVAMARHQRYALGRVLSSRTVRLLRVAAWLLLAAAPLPWMAERGALMSLVTWLFCGLPVMGLAVAAALTKKGRS